MNIDQLKKELRDDEGFVSHEYKDHLGYSTIGIGRLIDKRKGGGLSEEEAYYLLENDIAECLVELRRRLPFWNRLDDARQRALVNMAFQMGVNGLMNFKKMLAAIERGQWEQASKEGLDSLWAKQTPKRAKRVMAMIRHGG